MEKVSRILTGLMLLLCAALLCMGLIAGTFLYWQHPSFLAALLGALLFLGLALLLRRRGEAALERFERLGPARCALWLCLLCLAVNGLWLVFVRLRPAGDYSVFWKTAQLLSRGERPEGDLNLYLTLFPHLLGYSGFLAPFLCCFGCSTAVPVLWNLAFTCASCLLLFRLCLRWRGLRTAVVAALLWCFLPSKMFFNAMVLSEPLYTFLLLSFLALVQTAEESGSLPMKTAPLRIRPLPPVLVCGAASGLLLRMMNTARPIAAVPLIAVGIWILLLRGKTAKPSRWLAWGSFLILLLAAYFAFGLVTQRVLTGVLGREPARIPGYNIYVGFNPETSGTYSEDDMGTFGDVLHGPGEEDVNQTQRLMLGLALERAKSVDLPRLMLGKLRSFLGSDETGAYHSSQVLSGGFRKLCILVSNAWYYLLILLSLAGMRRLWSQRNHSAVLLAPLYIIGLTLAQMLAEVQLRYHYSLLPMLVILAAFSCREKAGADPDGKEPSWKKSPAS